jgi:hypothetical protein
MEEQDKKLSWPDFFLVTSACFFLFSVYLKFIEVESPGVFLWVALGCLLLGILSMAANIVISPGEKAD